MGLSDYLVDYTAHGVQYAVLTLLLWRAVRHLPPWGASPLLFAGAVAAVYAGSDEIHQIFVPGRCATLVDWLADVAGVVAVSAAVAAWTRLRGRVDLSRDRM